jgi:hypothetical protein
MDESVRRALARWPGVPDCYGWLRLDARGNWRVRDERGSGAGDAFSRITNPGLVEFVNRNYIRGDDGRYYFQNGPQRVFVECEYTPYVYRLSDDLAALLAHTGAPCTGLHGLLVDEDGALLLDAASGPGVLLDRDLPALLTRLRDTNGRAVEPEDLLELPARPAAPVILTGFGATVRVEAVRRAAVARIFGFNPQPAANG